ncbi:hypothetical protein V9L05_08120 [Bernardetia sp. Wsw4-3y2]|uniref:hypothetical protein n=1 Tax=Bernardetia sp. Wsw4-3y2 TaxID=3127471 RepID=UPI0030D19EFD
MRYKIVLIYLFLILLSLSCREAKKADKLETANNQIIKEYVFGRFCGECRGICTLMYKFTLSENDTLMYSDYSNSYFTGNLKFLNEVKSKQNKQNIYAVLHSFPSILYENKEKMYGYPDYTDGCGIYFEFTTIENQTYKFTMDFRKSEDIPNEITDYTYKMNSLVNKIFNTDSLGKELIKEKM